MSDRSRNRNRNTAMMLIIAGLYFLIGKMVGFMFISSVILIMLGFYRVRHFGDMKGYVVLIVGAILLFGNALAVFAAIILIVTGFFYVKSRKSHINESYRQSHHIIDSIRWDRQPWTPANMCRWHIFGETRIDLSLAMQDEEEVVIMLNGVFGSVHVIFPVDYGLMIESNIWMGRIDVDQVKDAGVLNKRNWKSDNYEFSKTKVKLIVSYAVGDVEIKMV